MSCLIPQRDAIIVNTANKTFLPTSTNQAATEFLPALNKDFLQPWQQP